MKEQVRRRSQAERKVDLRQAVLSAAVSTLHEHGYGGTTTVMVAQRAGISRGAMLNHFPTKTDLMIFVVEAVYAAEAEEYGRTLAGIDDPRERTLANIDAAWRVLSRPSGVATLEILMGSRSDAALAERLKTSLDKIQADAIETIEHAIHRPLSRDLLRLIVWAIRGLSIENMLSGGEGAEASVAMLRALVEQMFFPGEQMQRANHPEQDLDLKR